MWSAVYIRWRVPCEGKVIFTHSIWIEEKCGGMISSRLCHMNYALDLYEFPKPSLSAATGNRCKAKVNKS